MFVPIMKDSISKMFSDKLMSYGLVVLIISHDLGCQHCLVTHIILRIGLFYFILSYTSATLICNSVKGSISQPIVLLLRE